MHMNINFQNSFIPAAHGIFYENYWQIRIGQTRFEPAQVILAVGHTLVDFYYFKQETTIQWFKNPAGAFITAYLAAMTGAIANIAGVPLSTFSNGIHLAFMYHDCALHQNKFYTSGRVFAWVFNQVQHQLPTVPFYILVKIMNLFEIIHWTNKFQIARTQRSTLGMVITGVALSYCFQTLLFHHNTGEPGRNGRVYDRILPERRR